MEDKKRIYCIEGVHDWGDGEVEPTVEPMLELLQKLGSWDYLHRSCATEAELKYRLKTEWNECCSYGSVLYFFMHGAADQIWLRKDEGGVGLLTLKEWPDCEGCHIHFGGCDTFSKGEYNLKDLMEYTKATSVSGYATESGWLDWKAPAVLLELQLFWHLESVDLAQVRGRAAELEKIRTRIGERFPDCQFNMLVRRHRQS